MVKKDRDQGDKTHKRAREVFKEDISEVEKVRDKR